MKSTELRIGNLTTAGKVIEIHEDYFYVHDGESSLKSSWFEAKPIPLNEEWLFKFGFRGNPIQRVLRFVGLKLHGKIWYYTTNGNNDVPILYVHTLQNLYFALTNEELTLKP